MNVLLLLLAAEPASAPVPPDWSALAAAAITALSAVLVTVVVWGTKRALPKIPRAMLPLLAMAMGVAMNALTAWGRGGPRSVVYGALTGALALWLREATNTVREHGTEP